MFRIKICGITTVEDALAATAAGADAIGLNFYERSPRFVSVQRAQEIVAALPPQVAKVGVFVNSLAKGVRATWERACLSAVQLHGDENAEFLQLLAGIPVIRAFRCKEATLDGVEAYLRLCEKLGSLPDGVLLDAHAPGSYGGTGQVLDWNAIQTERRKTLGLPLILAGGLTPDNVAKAIELARPDAVDTASGVESAPGKKDPAMVQAFVAAASAALDR